MGVSGLFQFLKDYKKKISLCEFNGKIGAIDAFCWLHKGFVRVCISNRKSTKVIFLELLYSNMQWICNKSKGHFSFCASFRLADTFQNYLSVVKKAGVIPYVVFDGLLLPAKAGEVEKRQRWYVKNNNCFEHDKSKILYLDFSACTLCENLLFLLELKKSI